MEKLRITKLDDLVRAVDNYTSKHVKIVDSRYLHVDTFIEARIVRQVSASCNSLLNTEFVQVMLCLLTNSFTDLILGVKLISLLSVHIAFREQLNAITKANQ